jgi:hypothetical protein
VICASFSWPLGCAALAGWQSYGVVWAMRRGGCTAWKTLRCHPIHHVAPSAESGGLRRFALAIHCGGCMVDHQKIRARISDLKEAGVPVTNYGLLLSYAHSPAALERALAPWGLHCA